MFSFVYFFVVGVRNMQFTRRGCNLCVNCSQENTQFLLQLSNVPPLTRNDV